MPIIPPMSLLTVVIQAGGRSRRMGQDKGMLEIAGISLVQHILTRTKGLGNQTLITTNHPQNYAHLGVPLVGDAQPGAGALPGLQTALQAATTDHVLLLACDMPFINPALLQFMISLRSQADVIVPRWNGYYQPLHAIYARQTVLTALNQALANGQKRMISFYDAVQVKTVEPETITQFDPKGLTFFNANTPAELAEAEQIWSKLENSL